MINCSFYVLHPDQCSKLPQRRSLPTTTFEQLVKYIMVNANTMTVVQQQHVTKV